MIPRAHRLDNGVYTIVNAQGRVLEYAVQCGSLREAQALADGMPRLLALPASSAVDEVSR